MRSKSTSGQTECSCNHMTHFAVLFDYGDDFEVMFIEIPRCFSQLCCLSMCNNGDVNLLTLTLNLFCPQFVNQVTKTDEKVLKILTYVGLAFSITGIILTIIPYLLFT